MFSSGIHLIFSNIFSYASSFDNLLELRNIVDGLTEDKYNEMLPNIEANFEKAKEFLLPDEWVYKAIKGK